MADLGEEEGGIDFYRPPYNTRHTFITLIIERWSLSNQFDPRKVVELADFVGNQPNIIFEHYLGRSGDTSLVNIDIDEPPLDESLSQHKEAYPYQELQAQIVALQAKLAAEKQLNEELTQRLEASQHLQSLPVASTTVLEVIPKFSPVLQHYEPVKSKTSRRTQPSAFELGQLTLFSALEDLTK